MRISWFMVGSRIAVIALIYLLLTIPDSRFQGQATANYNTDKETYYSEKLITLHVPNIIPLTDNEKINISDSLNRSISTKILGLNRDHIKSSSKEIDTISFDLGLLTSVIGSTDIDVKPTLNTLWQWRKLIKKQSMSWSMNKEEIRLKTASIFSFINKCEEYIAINRKLSFTLPNDRNSNAGLELLTSEFKAGDIVLRSKDNTYPFYGLSKVIPDNTPSLSIISRIGDSIFSVSTAPPKGLISELYEYREETTIANWMHLRLRQDLPELIRVPNLPGLAAEFAYKYSRAHKKDYDYLFAPRSYSSLYEVELMRFAYNGINLPFIMPFSSIQNQYVYGLNSLGIRNFDVVSSSEIQFSPAIDYISIMQNGTELRKRNLEMAAKMASLSSLDHDLVKSLRWKLPKYRVLNGLSRILRLFNKDAIIPNGMASETALITNHISEQQLYLLPLLEKKVDLFVKTNRYYPTYPEMLDLANSVLAPK